MLKDNLVVCSICEKESQMVIATFLPKGWMELRLPLDYSNFNPIIPKPSPFPSIVSASTIPFPSGEILHFCSKDCLVQWVATEALQGK